MPMNKRIVLASLIMIITLAAGGTALAASNRSINQELKKINRQSIKLTAEQKAELETKRAAMVNQKEAIEAALTAGDYQAWVNAQQIIDKDCPILAKITKDNFDRYVASWRLRQQAELIDQELGIDRSKVNNFGNRPGFGQGRRSLEIKQ